jgi:hypothetical protein
MDMQLVKTSLPGPFGAFMMDMDGIEAAVSHNALQGLQGGAADQYYHLDATEFGFLDGQDQSVLTTSDVAFNSLTVGGGVVTCGSVNKASGELAFTIGSATQFAVNTTRFRTNGVYMHLGVNPGDSTEYEFLRFGRAGTDIRYHSIKAKNYSTPNTYLGFHIHDGGPDPYLTQVEVLRMNPTSLEAYVDLNLSADLALSGSTNPKITLTTSGGRTAVLQSKDSEPYCSVGTTTSHTFQLVTANTRRVSVGLDYFRVEEGVDFHVEGSTSGGYLLYCDQANDRVGINTNAPGAELHVVGEIRQSADEKFVSASGNYIKLEDDSITSYSTNSIVLSSLNHIVHILDNNSNNDAGFIIGGNDADPGDGSWMDIAQHWETGIHKFFSAAGSCVDFRLILDATAGNDDTLGILYFGDDTDNTLAAISGIAQTGGTSTGGSLAFYTESIDGTTMNERMAIGSEGYVSIQSRLYVYGDVTTLESSLSNFPRLQINSTHDGGLGGEIRFYKNSASPADYDWIGEISWWSKNDAAEAIEFVNIRGMAFDVSDGTEDCYLIFDGRSGGSVVEWMRFQGSTGTYFNYDKDNLDFVVRTTGNDTMFFIDGGNDVAYFGNTAGTAATNPVLVTESTAYGDHALVIQCQDGTNNPRLFISGEDYGMLIRNTYQSGSARTVKFQSVGTTAFQYDTYSFVVNPDQEAGVDFKVSTADDEYAICTDGQNNRIGFLSATEGGHKIHFEPDLTGVDTVGLWIEPDWKTVSANESNLQEAFRIRGTSWGVGSGYTDSGSRYGIRLDSHTVSGTFQGTLDRQYGIYLYHGTNGTSPTGTLNESYGLFVSGLYGANSSIGTSYGVYITSVETDGDQWGIYQNQSFIRNYFSGAVGIGTGPTGRKAPRSAQHCR